MGEIRISWVMIGGQAQVSFDYPTGQKMMTLKMLAAAVAAMADVPEDRQPNKAPVGKVITSPIR